MLKLTTFLIATLLSVVVVQAQQPSEAPFAKLEKAVQEERWGGNKERLSKVFDDERRSLGAKFQTELLKWLGADPARHYWVSAFIDYETYLYGNERLPELSLLIKQQGLELVRGKSDEESLGYIVGLSVTAATLSSELGLESLAISHKSVAQAILQVNPLLSSTVPAMSEAEWKRYDAINTPAVPKSPKVVVDDGSSIVGGVMNGRAIKLPKPDYPRAARQAGASGQVTVRVLIDVTGRVISAVATSGHPELQRASEEAAMRAEFTPTKLGGHAVKVTGIIIYNFVYR